jgi:hypothetical protein
VAARVVAGYAALLPVTGHSPRMREALTSMALVTCLGVDLPELDATVLSWLPEDINLPNLAYNLACYHATRGHRAELDAATRQARLLGTGRANFETDTEFRPYLDDPEFRAALA